MRAVHGEVDSPSATFQLKIERQPMDGALQQLARQCNLQVIFFSRVTEGVAAPAIEGEFTVDAAMAELLTGSNLTFRVINAQTVEVRPVLARERSLSNPVQRSSRPPEDTDTAIQEVVVVGLAEQLVATRIATPIREITQSVSIVTGEQIRQQNNLDLADVLSHVPGVTTVRSTSLSQEYHSRGYQITSIHVDGGAAIDPTFGTVAPLAFISADLNEFDHVEVLRGSDALFGGYGAPGGTLSLVRKVPQRAFELATSVTGGSWGKQRVEVDVTGPIALDGALRARAGAVYSRNNYFYDYASAERTKFFASIAWDISPDATLIVGGSHQSDDAVPALTDMPRDVDGSDLRLPRSTAFVFDWQRLKTRITESYLQYRHSFGDEWNLKLGAARWQSSADLAQGIFRLDVFTGRFFPPEFEFSNRPIELSQLTADATLTGVFDWFGMREEIAVGYDFTRIKTNLGFDAFTSDLELADVRNFDPRAYPDPRLERMPDLEAELVTRDERYGAFASVRVYLNEAWSVTAGARSSGFSLASDITLRSSPFGFPIELNSAIHNSRSRIFTPYLGLMYTIGENYSVYASYADIYADLGLLLGPDGRRLREQHGVTLEAGIKGEWRDGALNGSLVLYSVTQNNSAGDVVPAIPGMEYDGVCCIRGLTSRSKGIEIDLRGEVRNGWQLGIGYAYNENELPGGEQFSGVTPKHLLKAWTSVRLPENFSRWTFGGSLHAQSAVDITTEITTAFDPLMVHEGDQRAYAVLDLRAGFDIDSNWQLALSVNNALDKIYYESVGIGHNWYGEPRNVTLRIDGRY